ncbi:hypothetical protein E9677_17780 [Rhizobium rhizophilum]|uniref:TraD/TraG TraM recognition site domain-containing protein n=1 Tax=Rhizobium rhizophilum TaxID=1850373 RepID=A0ABY2QUH2_9HYPH|nr:hypothetical protein E9677_17780 [Rhizobium rhizophilum]
MRGCPRARHAGRGPRDERVHHRPRARHAPRGSASARESPRRWACGTKSFGERSRAFLSNASVCQVFGVNDIETTNLVSRMDAHDATSSWNSPNLPWTPPGHISSEHVVARDLITPDEIIHCRAKR